MIKLLILLHLALPTKTLELREGFRASIYKDSLGHDTIGYGHLVKGCYAYEIYICSKITKEQGRIILKHDVRKATASMARLLHYYNIDMRELTASQKEAIRDMVFQLGYEGAKKFSRVFTFIREGMYDQAAREAERSKWFKQTPVRVRDFQRRIVR